MAYANRNPEQLPVNIGAYLKRKYAIHDTPSRITPDGKCYRNVKGAWYSEKEFLAAHPEVKLFTNEFTKETIGHIN